MGGILLFDSVASFRAQYNHRFLFAPSYTDDAPHAGVGFEKGGRTPFPLVATACLAVLPPGIRLQRTQKE
jgi:hypothetical protein